MAKQADRSLEITTSAALIVNYMLGVLVGLGHIFTPVAGAIVMTMLLAWKTELSRFAGGLFRAAPMIEAKAVKSVVEKFREKYGASDVKKYYSKFDVAVVTELV